MKNLRFIALVLFMGQAMGMLAPVANPPQRTPQTAASLTEQSASAIAKKGGFSFEELNNLKNQVAPDAYSLIVMQALKTPKIVEQIRTFAKGINSMAEFKQKTQTIAPELYCPIIKEIVKNLTKSTKFTNEDLLTLINQYCDKEITTLYAYAVYKFKTIGVLDHFEATSRVEMLSSKARNAADQLGMQVTKSIFEFLDPLEEYDANFKPIAAPASPLATAQKANRTLAIEFFKSMGLKN